MTSLSPSVLAQCATLVALILAVVGKLLYLMHEVPVSESEMSLDHLLDPSNEHAYNIVDLAVPSSSGRLLPILSYIATKSMLSPWILRHLLNKNGAPSVRQFAARYCRRLPPTHFPIHRATAEDMELARTWRDGCLDTVLRHGLDLSPSTSGSADRRFRSVMDYHGVYRSRTATPVEVMERWIQGAEQNLRHLHIFSDVSPESIRSQARASAERWANGDPLSVWDGVPVAVKDMSPVRGYSLCDGSSVCSPPMDRDDLPAERLRAAGAILVGMTVMTEGGVTPLGYAAHFDGPFNAYHTGYYSGGSSGGSAVAVASGLVPMAVGWDGGGSIRVPASMSGVMGLATTFGRIPFSRGSSSTNIKAGPLAATMVDVALSYLVLSESDPSSFYQDLYGDAYLPPPHLRGLVDDGLAVPIPRSASLRGVRLGVFWDHFRHTDPEVVARCAEVVRYLVDEGAELVNITIPHLREIHLSHAFKIMSEFGITWESAFYNASHALEANTDVTVRMGRTLTADEVLAAEKVRTFAIRYVRTSLFATVRLDAIVSPMLGAKVPAPPRGYRGYGESNTGLVYKIMRFVPMANFLGLPALSVPVGYEKDTGLPIGFQFMGDAWSESVLIRLGCVAEKFLDEIGGGRKLPPNRNYFDVLEPWLQ